MGTADGARKKTEAQIQEEIQEYLGAQPDCLVTRRNIVDASVWNPQTGRTQHVRAGDTGEPDLEVTLAPGGRRLGFEVKTATGKLRPSQEQCHRKLRRFGVLVYVVRSVDDAARAIEAARRGEEL